MSGRADKNAERKLQSITSSKVHQKVDRRQTIDIRVHCNAKLSLLSIFTTQRTSLCLSCNHEMKIKCIIIIILWKLSPCIELIVSLRTELKIKCASLGLKDYNVAPYQMQRQNFLNSRGESLDLLKGAASTRINQVSQKCIFWF